MQLLDAIIPAEPSRAAASPGACFMAGTCHQCSGNAFRPFQPPPAAQGPQSLQQCWGYGQCGQQCEGQQGEQAGLGKESCWCCFCARRADLRMVFLWASCWAAGRYGESWLQAGDIAANGDASSQEDCHWTCRIRKMWLLFFGWFRTFHLYRTFLCQGRLRWLWLNATAAESLAIYCASAECFFDKQLTRACADERSPSNCFLSHKRLCRFRKKTKQLNKKMLGFFQTGKACEWAMS